MGMTASDYFRESFEAEEIMSMVGEELCDLEERFENQINELKSLFINELEKQKNEINSLKIENYQLISENEKLRNQIIELKAERNKNSHTLEMQIINEVYAKFWENLKSNEIPPKKETVVDWIKSEYGISNRIAEAIDTIVRPEQHRTGGLKTR